MKQKKRGPYKRVLHVPLFVLPKNQKTTSIEGKREYQRLWMARFREIEKGLKH